MLFQIGGHSVIGPRLEVYGVKRKKEQKFIELAKKISQKEYAR